MTRPTDWDFSKVSGKGDAPVRPEPVRGEMPAFAIHIEKRARHPEEALPWADVEFERISKSPRRAAEPAPVMAAKRRFPRFRLRRAKRKEHAAKQARALRPAFKVPRLRVPQLAIPRMRMPPMPRVAIPRMAIPRMRMPRVTLPRFTPPRLTMPRVPMPRLAMPRLAMPHILVSHFAMPRISAPRIPMPRLSMPRLPMPRFPGLRLALPPLRDRRPRRRPSLPRVDWRSPASRLAGQAAALRASLAQGWRVSARGLWVAMVAFQWLGAELVYFTRLGYARASLIASRFGSEARVRAHHVFAGVDLRPLARQFAVVALFVVAGYGAAQIVGPVLKNGGTRLAAVSPLSAEPSAIQPVAAETQAAIASLDEAVPLPMPRIAHVPMQVRKKASPLQTVAAARYRGAEDADAARRLMPASQTHGRGSLYAGGLVSEIQIRLLRFGYPVGVPTGRMNAKTRRAILLYQRDALLPVSGEADMRLLRRLRETEGRNMRFAGR